MSGFEIVGVVLGVIPLLVEGLKAYQHGLETATQMVKYEKAIGALVLRFGVASSLYMHSCERLIRPLMLEVKEWSELVDNPGGAAWKDEELGRQIRDRLGSDYSMYIEIARRLHKQLIKFAAKLDLDPTNDLKPKWLVAPPVAQISLRQKFFQKSNQTWKGLKVGFSNGSLEEALRRIETDLDTLNRLLAANEREAPMRRERKRRGNAKIWQSIRDAAKNVHAALAAHWQCPIEHQHAASLKLESRNASEGDHPVRFGLILSSDHTGHQPSGSLWHELEVEPVLDDDPGKLQVQTQNQNQALSPISITPAPVMKSTFKVTFAASMSSGGTTMTQTKSQMLKQSITSRNKKIHDLCRWQQSCGSSIDESMGFVEHKNWHHHFFQNKTKHTKPSKLSLLSLRDCVTRSSNSTAPVTPIFARGLSTKEKYNIATVLASSVLQLADTPWLPVSAFDLSDIFLIDLQQRALTAANPYIQRRFPSSTRSSLTPSTPLIENELVFALGVILIELAFQQPLADFKQACDTDAQGNDYPHTNLQIATRLVKDLQAMEGERYADAARRCVKCNFDTHEYSLENPDFQEQFYSGVVQPLQDLKAELK